MYWKENKTKKGRRPFFALTNCELVTMTIPQRQLPPWRDKARSVKPFGVFQSKTLTPGLKNKHTNKNKRKKRWPSSYFHLTNEHVRLANIDINEDQRKRAITFLQLTQFCEKRNIKRHETHRPPKKKQKNNNTKNQHWYDSRMFWGFEATCKVGSDT